MTFKMVQIYHGSGPNIILLPSFYLFEMFLLILVHAVLVQKLYLVAF